MACLTQNWTPAPQPAQTPGSRPRDGRCLAESHPHHTCSLSRRACTALRRPWAWWRQLGRPWRGQGTCTGPSQWRVPICTGRCMQLRPRWQQQQQQHQHQQRHHHHHYELLLPACLCPRQEGWYPSSGPCNVKFSFPFFEGQHPHETDSRTTHHCPLRHVAVPPNHPFRESCTARARG